MVSLRARGASTIAKKANTMSSDKPRVRVKSPSISFACRDFATGDYWRIKAQNGEAGYYVVSQDYVSPIGSNLDSQAFLRANIT